MFDFFSMNHIYMCFAQIVELEQASTPTMNIS